MRGSALVVLVTLLLLAFPCPALAHPVPRGNHDRKIIVELTPDPQNNVVRATVAYRLEVDELTVLLEDMVPFRDQIRIHPATNKPLDVFDDFTRIFAPILARNLIATANSQPLTFQCDRRGHSKTDDDGNPLGHLRCDFVFSAAFPAKTGERHSFAFRENNYERQSGLILLSTRFGPGSTPSWRAQILNQTVPDAALQAKSPLALEPGDDAKLRELAIEFQYVASEAPLNEAVVKPTPHHTPAPETPQHASDDGVLALFLNSNHGPAMLLLLAALIGAAHALTPGHGKTLVAAYLVGQRGTVAHALFLGLVTTITHTGIVLLIAVGLFFVDEESRKRVADTVGLGMGIALFCLGVWLLLQRLAGRADHVHLPSASSPSKVGVGGLLVMGITGGIVPCWDAVAMLGLAIGMNLLWLALPMLIAFSAGLAAVLVAIGILVVHARKLADARWSDSRVIRLLPIASALFIAAMGVLVCLQGAHGQ